MGKILVVDDEEDQEELIMQRFATKDYLQGYQFLFANDGLKGLAMVKIHPDIDLALLDINMPGMFDFVGGNQINQSFDPGHNAVSLW